MDKMLLTRTLLSGLLLAGGLAIAGCVADDDPPGEAPIGRARYDSPARRTERTPPTRLQTERGSASTAPLPANADEPPGLPPSEATPQRSPGRPGADDQTR